MIPRVVEYGMVVISKANDEEAALYGYVVLPRYLCNLTSYLEEQA